MMEYKRLNQNISILNMHNHNFRSVMQLTNGKMNKGVEGWLAEYLVNKGCDKSQEVQCC